MPRFFFLGGKLDFFDVGASKLRFSEFSNYCGNFSCPVKQGLA